jgi:proteic killer suppression protein
LITSFGDAVTREIYNKAASARTRAFGHDVLKAAKRKLDMIDAAHNLGDLKAPPNNKLEALKDDLIGFHSIRVNDRWRIIFRWQDGSARDVKVKDYH